MGPENTGFSGWWIFPIIMCIIMMIFFFRKSGRGGFRPPWMQDSDMHHREYRIGNSLGYTKETIC